MLISCPPPPDQSTKPAQLSGFHSPNDWLAAGSSMSRGGMVSSMVPAAAMQLCGKLPTLRRTQSSSGGSGSTASIFLAAGDTSFSPNMPCFDTAPSAPCIFQAPRSNYIEVTEGPLQVSPVCVTYQWCLCSSALTPYEYLKFRLLQSRFLCVPARALLCVQASGPASVAAACLDIEGCLSEQPSCRACAGSGLAMLKIDAVQRLDVYLGRLASPLPRVASYEGRGPAMHCGMSSGQQMQASTRDLVFLADVSLLCMPCAFMHLGLLSTMSACELCDMSCALTGA